MLKKYRIPLIALVAVLQTAALIAMVAAKQRTLATGTPVVLKTEPIDPRSLFRGDYVRLNYAISSLNYAVVEGDNDFKRHDRVYVMLRKGEEYWDAVSIHHERPVHGPDSVIIRGEAQYSGIWSGGEERGGINVRYGIENYFVPEGEGMALERPAEGDVVSILIAVDDSGTAGIKGVLVNGELRYEESLF